MPRWCAGDFAPPGNRSEEVFAGQAEYDLIFDEEAILQSVAAQYGVLPSAQGELPWAEWVRLVSGLMEETPLGKLVAVRTERDPDLLRRMTPWQRKARREWNRFLARRAGRTQPDRTAQRALQAELARMFGGDKQSPR